MRVPTERIRELRRHQTDAERSAWRLLRNRRIGLKIHRQYAIGPYVVDFYCFEARVAIELDGGAHSQPSRISKDKVKDAYLRSLGIRVLRLPNGMVLEAPEDFVSKVREAALPF
ncbi:MAG TPA: endonuclease domain-containing protein [Terriglobia bacterium]|nr:endonuclease domain-containing protein [Terriglobia bacterium]